MIQTLRVARIFLKQTSLNEWLELLETRHPNAIDLGLDRVSQVAERLNLINLDATVISVAGTNGKGSCIATMEGMLLAGGVRVGSYTSPHLVAYNERICIAGEPVGDQDICAAFAHIERARGSISLTYFEFGTLAALWVFKHQVLDVVLLEVGLGGRLDAVNIVDADVAVVTSIDLDHQEWLGDDRESIGVEKVAIARAGRPLVCADAELPAGVLASIKSINPREYMLGSEAFNISENGQALHLTCTDLSGRKVTYVDLPQPQLPRASALSAVQALVCAGRPPSPELVHKTFVETGLSGRFQTVRFGHHDVILDVAHNPAATQLLANKINSRTHKDGRGEGHRKIHGLFGVLADKDIGGMIKPLLSVIDVWYLCDMRNVSRAVSSEDVARRFCTYEISVRTHASVALGLKSAIEKMADQDVLLIFGSFHIVSEALHLMDKENARTG